MKRLCIFIVVVIAQLRVFVEIYRTIHQKELTFLYVNLKQYAVTEGRSWDSESCVFLRQVDLRVCQLGTLKGDKKA